MGIVRTLAWSHSRGQLWRSCERAFYFGYCSEGDEDLQTARLLRSLKESVAVSAGIVADDHVNLALRRISRGKEPAAEAVEEAVNHLALVVANSPAKAEVLRGGLALRDHEHCLTQDYYGFGFADGEVERALNQVESSIEGFLASPVLEKLRRCAPGSLGLPRRRPTSFAIEGMLVYVKPDLLVRHGRRIGILDWKTGRRSSGEQQAEGVRRQLGLYALYANVALGYDVENVLVQAVWLRDGANWEPEPVTEFLLELVREEMLEMANEVRSRLVTEVGADGETVWRADRADFPARPHLRRCSRCKWLELCEAGNGLLSAP